MNIKLWRLATFGGTLFAAVLFVAVAAPANTTLAPPPEKFEISPGGVDMRSGRFVYSQTDLAIGGAGGLALTRSLPQQVVGHDNPLANFSHNWDILLTEKRVNIDQGDFRNATGNDYQIEVGFGGLSRAFRASSAAQGFYQVSRSGFADLTFTGDKASAAVVYTYRSGDGTEAVFRGCENRVGICEGCA